MGCVTLLFATFFPFPSKPFPDIAGLRADSHKLQKPLEIGVRLLTEPATHREAPTPLPGKVWDLPWVGCSSNPRPGRSRGCLPRGGCGMGGGMIGAMGGRTRGGVRGGMSGGMSGGMRGPALPPAGTARHRRAPDGGCAREPRGSPRGWGAARKSHRGHRGKTLCLREGRSGVWRCEEDVMDQCHELTRGSRDPQR